MTLDEIKHSLPMTECVAKEIYNNKGDIEFIITSLIELVDEHLIMAFKLYAHKQGNIHYTGAVAFSVEELEDKVNQLKNYNTKTYATNSKAHTAVHKAVHANSH